LVGPLVGYTGLQHDVVGGHGGEVRAHDVADVYEVAGLCAVAVYERGLPPGEIVGELGGPTGKEVTQENIMALATGTSDMAHL
jgi:hypothetical protein